MIRKNLIIRTGKVIWAMIDTHRVALLAWESVPYLNSNPSSSREMDLAIFNLTFVSCPKLSTN